MIDADNEGVTPMTLRRIDIGFVSADRSLVDFLAEVFELDALPGLEATMGTIYKLGAPGSVIKIMVPNESPASPPSADPFFSMGGLRYLTFRVDDVDAVVKRAIDRGAVLQSGPSELPNGVRIAFVLDPDGNTIEIAQDPA